MALGDELREDAPSRPSWWPDPENTKFETTFDVPFSAQSVELRLEVLNVNSSKNFIKINGAPVGALYPDTGMTFKSSVIMIPLSMINLGENSLVIEADKGTKGDYDDFLIRNVDLVLYRSGDEPLAIETPAPVYDADPYNPEDTVTLEALTDVLEGDEFTIKLISSSSEGYSWQLVDSSYDHKFLRLVSQNERVYDTHGRIEQQFNFLALIPGNTNLEFRKFYNSTGELAVLGSQVTTVQISRLIILTGLLQKLDYPVAQFGTHQLLDDMGNCLCILRSNNSEIRLDDYVGLKVKVAGKADSYKEDIQSMGLIFTVRNISVLSQ